MNYSNDLIEFVDDRPGHDLRYGLNSSKIRNELEWSESVNFEDGLKETINWYMNNAAWWDDIQSNAFISTPWKN